MKKEIKNYLNLYPRVPILICEPNVERVPDLLEGYDWILDKAIAERINYDPSWIKPILRKFSSMTKEEATHIADIGTDFGGRTKFEMQSLDTTSLQAYILIYHKTEHEKLGVQEYTEQIVIGYDGIYVRDFKYRDELKHHTHGFEIVRYLLQQRFDLFGLIEDCLAIDVATLK